MFTPGNRCDYCQATFELDREMTVIHFFECQTWFSYADNVCGSCGTRTKIFFRERYQECMDYFVIHDFEFEVEDFAPDHIVEAFEKTYNLCEIRAVGVTKRQELEIHNFSTVLANCPDDLLLSMFGEP